MSPSLHFPPFAVQPHILRICRQIRRDGGRALLVGGWVRDRSLGFESKDHDIEVFGLSLGRLEASLGRIGEVIAVGRSFGVFRVKGLDVDFSIPRRDSKIGPGHRGFVAELDPELDFATAARRRDLTINSMAYDPLCDEILDPHDGARDLERGVLRATDAGHFCEDSLRGLKVARFHARLGMEPDRELHQLCASLDLSDLPGERILSELSLLLLGSDRPAAGFEVLRSTGLIRFLPELEALIDVPQDRIWHPEGDVWTHTMLVLEGAARLRRQDEDLDLPLMWGALCHDLGKPDCTVLDGDRVRSPRHSDIGAAIAGGFLDRLRAPHELVRQVEALVRHHLAPTELTQPGVTDRAYRRLNRRLVAAGVEPDLLALVAEADHRGRGDPDIAYDAGGVFRRRMASIGGSKTAEDVVLGRHLMAHGLAPGPAFGPLLAVCRDLQDDTGWSDPERLLNRVMSEHPELVAAAASSGTPRS